MKNATKIIIVSRHPSAVEFIRQVAQLGDNVPVVEQATYMDVLGAVVYGNVPLHLAAAATAVVAIEFDGDPPRGQEYTLADMLGAGAKLRSYVVTKPSSADSVVLMDDGEDGYRWELPDYQPPESPFAELD